MGTQPATTTEVTPEAKPGEEVKPVEAKTAEGETAKPVETAPVEFKFEDLRLPENYLISDEQKEKLSAAAKEHKLSSAQLQPLLDIHNEQIAALQKAQSVAWVKTNEQWVSEVKAMPEFEGEKLAPAQAVVAKALDEYGTPEVRQAFDMTGAGNNPAIFRLIHNMAKALGEGTHASGGVPSGGRPSNIAESFYPNMKA